MIEILDACIWHDVCTIGSMSIFAKLGAMGAPSTWLVQATLEQLITVTGPGVYLPKAHQHVKLILHSRSWSN